MGHESLYLVAFACEREIDLHRPIFAARRPFLLLRDHGQGYSNRKSNVSPRSVRVIGDNELGSQIILP